MNRAKKIAIALGATTTVVLPVLYAIGKAEQKHQSNVQAAYDNEFVDIISFNGMK